MSDLIYSLGFPYGAPELVRNYRRHLSGGLMFAIALALTLLGIYRGLLQGEKIDPPPKFEKELKIDLEPPQFPPFEPNKPPRPSSPVAPAAEIENAIPRPVSDDKLDSNQTIVTQKEGATATDSSGKAIGEATGVGSGGENYAGEIKAEAGPPAFLKDESEPQLVKKVKPVYPEFARRAGLEGVVWLKIWVDKQGRPKKIVVLKSASEIFDQAALAAAEQFVFTPAMMQNSPVDVWVVLPFHFRLK